MEVLAGVLGRSQGVVGGSWEVPKTDDVFSERVGRILGGSWGGFGALGWSLGRTWELEMSKFHWFCIGVRELIICFKTLFVLEHVAFVPQRQRGPCFSSDV